jgi:hypothetical protein
MFARARAEERRGRPLNSVVSRHMNSALEFHDSEVAAVRAVAGTVRLELPSAYVHRSSGTPGVDPGEVFLQPAEVVFSNAVHAESTGPCIGALSDGSITVDGKPFSNMVPVPFRESGSVVASFSFVSGGVLSVTGSAVSCITSGKPTFVEKYDG